MIIATSALVRPQIWNGNHYHENKPQTYKQETIFAGHKFIVTFLIADTVCLTDS